VQSDRTLTLREEIVVPRFWNRTATTPEQITARDGRVQYAGSVVPAGQLIGMQLPAPGVGLTPGAQNLVGSVIRPVVVNV